METSSAGLRAPETERHWLRVRYRPVTLFSLRMTHATSKGGKTLAVPTPYSIKMALLDACFLRWDGEDAESRARKAFEWVKKQEVRIRPPAECVVQHTFVKILDASRDKNEGPFKRTIAYREFVHYAGELEVALSLDDLDHAAVSSLTALFLTINSLGKRGGFMQFLGAETLRGDLPIGFTRERSELPPEHTPRYMTSQALDDFGDALCKAKDGFERVSTYGGKAVTLDRHRVLRLTALPYRRHSASRRFTWYRRVEDPGGS